MLAMERKPFAPKQALLRDGTEVTVTGVAVKARGRDSTRYHVDGDAGGYFASVLYRPTQENRDTMAALKKLNAEMMALAQRWYALEERLTTYKDDELEAGNAE